MGKLTVMLADTAELRRAVFAFRYRIYVQHMRRRQRYADHNAEAVVEPMDASARNYLAVIGDDVVGVIRANMADDRTASYYTKLYMLPSLNISNLTRTQITTKLMIRPDLRGTIVGPRLVQFYADQGYKLGVELDLLDCNQHLIGFFERLGYFAMSKWVFHREYGLVRPMILAVDSVKYLRSIGSILAPSAEKRLEDGCYGGYDLVRRNAAMLLPPSAPAFQESYRKLFSTRTGPSRRIANRNH